jgi:hypothetical protein
MKKLLSIQTSYIRVFKEIVKNNKDINFKTFTLSYIKTYLEKKLKILKKSFFNFFFLK